MKAQLNAIKTELDQLVAELEVDDVTDQQYQASMSIAQASSEIDDALIILGRPYKRVSI